MKHLPSDAGYHALRMLEILQDMAANRTNATRMLLSNIERFEPDRHYPEAGIRFAGNHWCAYYHRHRDTRMHPDEHGHFHIFTDIGHPSWAHVAGLSIDDAGQPLQWFAVNRWVTDGPWLQLENCPDLMDLSCESAAAPNCDEGLVERWLTAMIHLYRESILELLRSRNARVLRIQQQGKNLCSIHENRRIYLLAARPVDLQKTLERHLSCEESEQSTYCGDSRAVSGGEA